MDIQATKIELAKRLLNETRESVLQKISQLLSRSDEIVAYSASREPLTKADYNLRLKEAERQIKAGEYLTQEELEKEMKTW